MPHWVCDDCGTDWTGDPLELGEDVPDCPDCDGPMRCDDDDVLGLTEELGGESGGA